MFDGELWGGDWCLVQGPLLSLIQGTLKGENKHRSQRREADPSCAQDPTCFSPEKSAKVDQRHSSEPALAHDANFRPASPWANTQNRAFLFPCFQSRTRHLTTNLLSGKVPAPRQIPAKPAKTDKFAVCQLFISCMTPNAIPLCYPIKSSPPKGGGWLSWEWDAQLAIPHSVLGGGGGEVHLNRSQNCSDIVCDNVSFRERAKGNFPCQLKRIAERDLLGAQ